jgi:hypothetical protein
MPIDETEYVHKSIDKVNFLLDLQANSKDSNEYSFTSLWALVILIRVR